MCPMGRHFFLRRKGFIVDDDEACESFLKQANYYRLSAYFLPFRNADRTYFENINFNRIKRIYEFDGRIRNLIFECIETIELYLRTQLAYYCGHAYGALGYLNPDIYNERHNDDKFKRLLDICIEENKMTLVVQHHKEFHTVEAMSAYFVYSCYISSSLEKTSRTCSK